MWKAVAVKAGLRAVAGSISVGAVVCVSLLVAGCFKPTQPGDDSRASFMLASLGAQGDRTLVSTVNRTVWKDLPTHQTFYLSACVRELPKQLPVQNHSFIIYDGPNKIATKTSDPSGCVNWEETIGYNILARPVSLTIERTIVADGKHQGKVKARFALNPWAAAPRGDSQPAVVDITIKRKPHEIPYLVDANTARTYMSPDSMVGVPPVDMFFSTVNYTFDFDRQDSEVTPTTFTFSGLKLRTVSREGAPAVIPIEQASFEFEPVFLMQDNSQRGSVFSLSVPAVPDLTKHKMFMNSGTATENDIPMRMNLQGIPNFNGIFDLSVTYAPTGDAPPGIRKLPVVYRIGSREALLKGGVQLDGDSQRAIGSPDIGALLARATQFQLRASQMGTQVSAPIVIDSVSGGPLVVDPQSASGKPSVNDITYAMRANVRRAISGAPWQRKQVIIEPVDPSDRVACGDLPLGRTATCTALDNGSLPWRHVFPNNTFRTERWVEKRIRFTDVRSKLTVENCFWVQMGGAGAGSTSSCETGPPDNRARVVAINRLPYIRVNGVSWKRLNVSNFRVDRSLDLSMTYDLSVTVSAGVVRPDSLKAGLNAAPDALTLNQYYGVTFMLIRNNPANPALSKILATMQVVRKYDGALTFTVPLEVQQWVGLLMSGTNYLFVEVVPIRHEALPADLLAGRALITDEISKKSFVPDVWQEQKSLAENERTSDIKAVTYFIPTDMSKEAGGGAGFSLDNTTDRQLVYLRGCDHNDSRPECKQQGEAQETLDNSVLGGARGRTGVRSEVLPVMRNRLDSRPLYAHHKIYEQERAKVKAERDSQVLGPEELLKVYKNDKNLQVDLKPYHFGNEPLGDDSTEFKVPVPINEAEIGRSNMYLVEAELKEALACLDQYSWAPELDLGHFQPKCMKDPRVKMLTSSLLAKVRAMPEIDVQDNAWFIRKCYEGVTKKLEQLRDVAFGQTESDKALGKDQPKLEQVLDPAKICSEENVIQKVYAELSVDERTFVYDIDENIEQQKVKSWISSWSVSSDYSIVNFDATDRGNMGQSGLDLGISPGTKFVNPGANWSHNAYVIDFTRDAQANSGNISNGATLVAEQLEVPLKLKKYRTCYIIRKRKTAKGIMVCAPTEENTKEFKEQYYLVYNPASGGVMVNPNNQNNRWMLSYRGEREQTRFMTALSCGISPFHQNNNVRTSADMFWRSHKKVSERWRGERGVVSSNAVGFQEYMRKSGTFREGGMPLHPFHYFGFRDFVDINAGEAQSWTRDRCWIESYAQENSLGDTDTVVPTTPPAPPVRQ